jgi:hypothetical protein
MFGSIKDLPKKYQCVIGEAESEAVEVIYI